MESNRISKHIDRLLLDPNNYRFIDRPDYKFVTDDQIDDQRIQQRTLNFIWGKNQENIKDLISSFTTNGFLDIDQIQVKPLGDKYVVLEGNRRTATLKYLWDEFKNGNDVGKLKESDFKSIQLVEIKDEDPVQHLITMGLHHLSGKKRWSAVNEAQLITDLIEKYGKTEYEVCEALGITTYKLRKNRRTLSLITQYKESDFGDQFEANKYSIFESVIGSPVMRTWIGWSDYDYWANNDENIIRFFTWISKTEEIEKDDDGVERSIIKEPIISQYRQIKELAEFINDSVAVKKMEESRSITEGYSYSEVIGETRLKNALENINSEVQVAFNFSEHLTTEEYENIERLKNKLDRLIPSSQALISPNGKTIQKYFSSIDKHFESIEIKSYRKLSDISVKHLAKVNIFAGGNNTGKTSILEAFYILSQLNDINSFLELEKYRGKFYNEFHSKWIDKTFINHIDISGIFNSINTSVQIAKEETEENIDKIQYLSTIKSEATVNGADLSSTIHLFSNKQPELKYAKTQILCSANFTSPYRYNETLLRKAHAFAIQEKYFEKIIEFIKEHLDKSIEKIELISDEGESRFMVSSSKLEKAIDITKYGEGLQRVFEIALLMVYSTNGILCIDEIDSAIHRSLLLEFTKFIQQTAERFNVQVFLSTHSKECIDAFVLNKYNTPDITAYALTEVDGKVQCKYVEGERLEQLIESINFDIR